MRYHKIALILDQGKVIARGSMQEMLNMLREIRITNPNAYIEERIW